METEGDTSTRGSRESSASCNDHGYHNFNPSNLDKEIVMTIKDDEKKMITWAVDKLIRFKKVYRKRKDHVAQLSYSTVKSMLWDTLNT